MNALPLKNGQFSDWASQWNVGMVGAVPRVSPLSKLTCLVDLYVFWYSVDLRTGLVVAECLVPVWHFSGWLIDKDFWSLQDHSLRWHSESNMLPSLAQIIDFGAFEQSKSHWQREFIQEAPNLQFEPSMQLVFSTKAEYNIIFKNKYIETNVFLLRIQWPNSTGEPSVQMSHFMPLNPDLHTHLPLICSQSSRDEPILLHLHAEWQKKTMMTDELHTYSTVI